MTYKYNFEEQEYRIERDGENRVIITRSDEPSDKVFVRLSLRIVHGEDRDCATLGYNLYHKVHSGAGSSIIENLSPQEVIDEACGFLDERIKSYYEVERVREHRAMRQDAEQNMESFLQELVPAGASA